VSVSHRIATACLGLTLAFALGCSEAPRSNLLVVAVDTLRWDHLGVYGNSREVSPEIDSLAQSGVRFERAYATAPWTQPSVASMLTGLHPASHGADRLLRVLPDSAHTLAERLAEQGYVTAAVVSHYLIGPRFGFDQGFETFVHGSALGPGKFSTPGVSSRGTELLSRFAASDTPFFLFLHYFDPHYSYERHARYGFAASGGAGRLTGGESMEELRTLTPPPDEGERRFVRDLYDEEVRFTDSGIGTVLRAIDRLGLRDDTIVVLVADHGEEFYERGWLGHTRTLHEELVRVPLILRVPGAGPAVVRESVSLAGLMPTLLDLLGQSAGRAEEHQAGSFAALVRGQERWVPQPIYLETEFFRNAAEGALAGEGELERRHALIVGDLKLIEDRMTGSRRLYDLGDDPLEERDLAASAAPGTRGDLEEKLRATAERFGDERLEGAAGELAPSAEEVRLLRELGYIAE
jgi:arylsulfatase A-like enzyme